MSKHRKHEEDNAAPVAGGEPVAAAAPADSAPQPEPDIEDIRRQSEEWHDRYLRSVAELQNVKRRHAEESDRIRDTATRDLVVALLPVVDDLERALNAADDDANPYRAGVQLVLGKLLKALESVGVERIQALGQPFDHNLHNAVQPVEPTEEFPAGTVAAELLPGYVQHGHVLRPAMVAVAHE